MNRFTQLSNTLRSSFWFVPSLMVAISIALGVFTYCLIVLRTIRGGDEGQFVPSLAVFFAFTLALGGVGVLIFFIHHIASSIQASSIIHHRVGRSGNRRGRRSVVAGTTGTWTG